MNVVNCPYCGHDAGPEEEFCPECKGNLTNLERMDQRPPEARQAPRTGRRTALLVLVVLLGLAGLAVAGYFFWQHRDQQDVAARVNDEKIYWRDVDAKLESFRKMLLAGDKTDFQSPEGKQLLQDLRNRILDSLIQEKILMNEVTRSHVSVSAEEVAERLAGVKKARGLTDQSFEELLQNHGLTMEDFKKRTQRELLVEKAMEKGARETGLTKDAWLERVFSLANVQVLSPKK